MQNTTLVFHPYALKPRNYLISEPNVTSLSRKEAYSSSNPDSRQGIAREALASKLSGIFPAKYVIQVRFPSVKWLGLLQDTGSKIKSDGVQAIRPEWYSITGYSSPLITPLSVEISKRLTIAHVSSYGLLAVPSEQINEKRNQSMFLVEQLLLSGNMFQRLLVRAEGVYRAEFPVLHRVFFSCITIPPRKRQSIIVIGAWIVPGGMMKSDWEIKAEVRQTDEGKGDDGVEDGDGGSYGTRSKLAV
ncbi:hypothetical protein DL95DRAFT_414366 [Leptodontidium sp. 2 PMI_412]|nr:hypothetical protein DL95DRAFT_414366 [Leptodontidium sp. 2 PMI_412]